jgi:hypothetical protein
MRFSILACLQLYIVHVFEFKEKIGTTIMSVKHSKWMVKIINAVLGRIFSVSLCHFVLETKRLRN